MQKWLSHYRNWLTAITGVLIILAFSSKWVFSSDFGSADCGNNRLKRIYLCAATDRAI